MFICFDKTKYYMFVCKLRLYINYNTRSFLDFFIFYLYINLCDWVIALGGSSVDHLSVVLDYLFD